MDSDQKIFFSYDKTEPVRLDIAVHRTLCKRSAYQNLSRSQVKNWIESGAAEVNGTVTTKAGATLHPGDEVSVTPHHEEQTDLEPYDFPLEIVYEDEHLIVVNKPAGLVVHPGAGRNSETLANAIVYHLGEFPEDLRGSLRPGIVHRLDADTTGLLVIAKNRMAHHHLAEQFANRSVLREYQALCLSTPRNKRPLDQSFEGTIDQPIGRSPNHRTQMAVVLESDPGAKRAVTHWRVLQRFDWANLVSLKLETGRTHQIRVHLAAQHSPILGDRVYGDLSPLPKLLFQASERFGRQALHAGVLGFVHPDTGETLSFQSDPPEDFNGLVAIFQDACE